MAFEWSDVGGGNWEVAMFQGLSSFLASLQTGRVAELCGFLPGHAVQQADATQVHMQSGLGGIKTYVRLPREAWPDECVRQRVKDHFCLLQLAVYGHPDDGGYWERTCEKHLVECVFKSIKNQRRPFAYEGLRVFASVSVDDFNMTARLKDMGTAWLFVWERRSCGIGQENTGTELPAGQP